MSDDADIEIRKGREADLAGIAGVLVDTWRSTFRGLLPDAFLDDMRVETQIERLHRRMRANEVSFFVAVAGQDILGFANSGPSRAARMPYGAELYALYVRKDRQGHGLGRQLVRAAAGEALRQQRRSMLVWVLAQNHYRRFYAKLGAVPVGRSPITLGGVTVDQIGYAWDDLMMSFGLEPA